MIDQISAQLWSVKDYTAKDFFKTLEEIAQIGYSGVEFAGYGNISAKDMKQKLNELNLNPISSHVSLERLRQNLDKEIEYLKYLGAKYIVCPSAEINTVENALRYADIFNKIGEKCSEAGLIFAYHNHAHEFTLDQGKYPLDILFNNTNAVYVKQQPDVFWIAYAGIDVIEYIKKNKSRCPIIHLKQLENNETRRNVDAGSGIIDFRYLIQLTPDSDFVYEQEQFIGTSIDNMKKSYNFIMNK